MDSKIISLMLLLLRAFFLQALADIFGVGFVVFQGWSFQADRAVSLASSRRSANAADA